MNAKAAVAPILAKVAGPSRALAYDPLSVDDILTGFYRPPAPSGTKGRGPAAPPPASLESPRPRSDSRPAPGDPAPVAEAPDKKPRPTHYKVVCISLYVEDIDRLDSLVAELKRRGHSKANKSQVIRAALEQIDLDRVPRSH
jgi:hypothetical protein